MTSARGACAASRSALSWYCTQYWARSSDRPSSRSFWMRSIMATSACWRARSKSRSISSARPSPMSSPIASSGRSSSGPQRITRAPSRGSSIAFDRATRLWRMSPVMTTVTPSSVFASIGLAGSNCGSRSNIVRRSSSACDGCWCIPSPAFSTGRPDVRASRNGEPDAAWRRMMHSAPRARSVRPVSFRLSPFSIEEDLSLTSVVVAPSDFAASSNEVRVLVLDS